LLDRKTRKFLYSFTCIEGVYKDFIGLRGDDEGESQTG
jgi:hypothetical protein